ncbi:MAG: cysteine--tRNA ligase, partial [Desulfamplus sp.]|nr:cysteine--tRNA ligase [Desulfamplus sp.]
KSGNKILDKSGESISSDKIKKVADICADIQKMGSIIGVVSQSPQSYFKAKKDAAILSSSIDPEMVDQLVVERTEARKSKNFARADEIRKELDSMNIILEDGANGTTWKFGQ